MKLLGSTKNKIINDINGKNVGHLEITKVVSIKFIAILSVMIINKIQES